MEISEKIKSLRKERKWTQARLAIEANVSQQAISFLERGRNEPSAEMIRALSKAFQINPSELFGENQNKKNAINQKHHELIEIFNQLNTAGKDFILQQARFAVSQSAFRQDKPQRSAI